MVAGAVFTLTAHLSQAVRTEQKQPLASGLGETQYAFMLDSSFTSPSPAQNPVVDFTSIGDSSLHIILKKLLDFILKTGFSFTFSMIYSFCICFNFSLKKGFYFAVPP